MPRIKASHQREHSAKTATQDKKDVLVNAQAFAPPVFTLDATSPFEEKEEAQPEDEFAPEALLEAAAADGPAEGENPDGEDSSSGGSSNGSGSGGSGNGEETSGNSASGGTPSPDTDTPDSEKHKRESVEIPAIEATNLLLHGSYRHPGGRPNIQGYRLVKNPLDGVKASKQYHQMIRIEPVEDNRAPRPEVFRHSPAIQMKPMHGGDGPPQVAPFVVQMHGHGGGPGGGPPSPPGGGGTGPVPPGPSPTPAQQEGPGLPPTDGGTKLPGDLMEKFEAAFSSDFSGIRLHVDSEYAEQIGAQAFVYGEHIYFAPGKFEPNSMNGIRLIAHEIVHVLQQREGAVRPNMRMGRLNINYDRRLEREADDFGRLAADFDMSWLAHWEDMVEDMVGLIIEYQENDGTWEGWENGAGAGAYEEYLDGHGEEPMVEPDYHTPEVISSPKRAEAETPAKNVEEPQGAGEPASVRDNPALSEVGSYLKASAAPVIAEDKAQIEQLGTNQRDKKDTSTKVVESKKASVQPIHEPGSRVERDKSDEMDAVETPSTHREEAKGQFDQKLLTILPKNLKDVYKFKKRKKGPSASRSCITGSSGRCRNHRWDLSGNRE